MKPNSLDIFCEVIDNFGDIGVVYRLAKEMKRVYPEAKIRVILNRLDEFIKINKKAKEETIQEIENIVYIKEEYLVKNIKKLGVADIFIEAFGCNINEVYLKEAKLNSKLWINLEYLSGEKWIEDFHLQTSMIDSKTLKKIFYMPGFTKKSGGLLIDKGYLKRKEEGQIKSEEILNKYFPNINFENKLVGTIFSYEKNFENLIEAIENQEKEIILLLMGEKTQKSFSRILKKNTNQDFLNFRKYGKICVYDVNFLSQEEYEEVISAVNFNFTRGEDSIIRGLLLGKPFLWHIYLQHNGIHMEKLQGFLDRFIESINFENQQEKNILLKYFKLLEDYNNRSSNNFERGNEDYTVFFKEFDLIEKLCKRYSEFLLENCNLTKKLYKYIKEN